MGWKYFTKIADGLDVGPALAEIEAGGWGRRAVQSQLDLQHRIQAGERYPSPGSEGRRGFGEDDFAAYPAVQALFDEAKARLTAYGHRALSAAVAIHLPQSAMKPHKDDMTRPMSRFHLAIQWEPKAYFRIRQERCRFKPGELWHVDIGNWTHFTTNPCDSKRVVMVIEAVEEEFAWSVVAPPASAFQRAA